MSGTLCCVGARCKSPRADSDGAGGGGKLKCKNLDTFLLCMIKEEQLYFIAITTKPKPKKMECPKGEKQSKQHQNPKSFQDLNFSNDLVGRMVEFGGAPAPPN